MMLAALSVGLYTDNSILKSISVCMTDTIQKNPTKTRTASSENQTDNLQIISLFHLLTRTHYTKDNRNDVQ